MQFFFPDNQDQIDPSFDFLRETRNVHRLRQRDDLYAHEVFETPTHQGILVSKTAIDGGGSTTSRYTEAQRRRFYREGVRSFFRLDVGSRRHMQTLGDCGAFSYVKEKHPPFTVDEVLDFYEESGFDLGVSVDHVILGFQPKCDEPGHAAPEEWQERQAITLELQEEFLSRHQARRCSFVPIGVAQGWSPGSYASSVEQLQKMGYNRIGIGGLVTLKSFEIISSLQAIDQVREPQTQLHLFGVTRHEHIPEFASYGVTSFDSTSPFRQAFKDERDNYYVLDGTYTAIRVPQCDKNKALKRLIQAGAIPHDKAVALEHQCLVQLEGYDRGEVALEEVLWTLREYEKLYAPKKNHFEIYKRTLQDKAWKRCSCPVCKDIGIHVAIFRGAERNKRRGFHNLYVFAQRLAQRGVGQVANQGEKGWDG